ncbi:hypothetical protein LV779_14190 [Streptomyces thinghirensis]|nr:hypothetical protein [Streptomyces thinghirensis]
MSGRPTSSSSSAGRRPASTGRAAGASCCRGCSGGLVEGFGRLKALSHPLDRMNPGRSPPYGLDENLRLGGR